MYSRGACLKNYYFKVKDGEGWLFCNRRHEKVVVSVERPAYNIPTITSSNMDDMRTFLSVTTTDQNEILNARFKWCNKEELLR